MTGFRLRAKTAVSVNPLSASGEGGESAAPEECSSDAGGESAADDEGTDGSRAVLADPVASPAEGGRESFSDVAGGDHGPWDEDVEQCDEANGDQVESEEGTPSEECTGCHWLWGDPREKFCLKDPLCRLPVRATDENGVAWEWTALCEEHLFIAFTLAAGVKLDEISRAIAAIHEWETPPVYSIERFTRLRSEAANYHFEVFGDLVEDRPPEVLFSGLLGMVIGRTEGSATSVTLQQEVVAERTHRLFEEERYEGLLRESNEVLSADR